MGEKHFTFKYSCQECGNGFNQKKQSQSTQEKSQ